MYKRITEDILRLYIEGSLDPERAEYVEAQIRESKDVFERYIELREALFLSKQGKQPDENFKERILKIVDQEKEKSPIPYIKIIIRRLKNKIIVLDGSQNKIDFRGVSASFAYRGSEDEAGPISISRKIGGREFTFILTPVTQQEYSISVSLAQAEALEAVLFVEEKEIEAISDISKKRLFDTYIPSNGNLKLIFKKDPEEICTVNFKMESDSGWEDLGGKSDE